jgi:hypothetical protein
MFLLREEREQPEQWKQTSHSGTFVLFSSAKGRRNTLSHFVSATKKEQNASVLVTGVEDDQVRVAKRSKQFCDEAGFRVHSEASCR